MELQYLQSATLVRREKRFLSLHVLKDGQEVWAHCPNPGSMRGNAIPGSKTKLQDFGDGFKKQGRKMRYRWQFVSSGRDWVCIDTSVANSLVKNFLKTEHFPELGKGKLIWTPEQVYDDARFDFGADLSEGKRYFLEVKSVSMSNDSRALFPDSVTLRGQKHLRGLMSAVKQGHKAALLFLITRQGCKTVSVANDIDPEYAKLLKRAFQSGVKIFARDLIITARTVKLGKALKVIYV